MSRLIDAIEKAGLQSTPPLGFGAAAGREQATPDLTLIESMRTEHIDSQTAASSPADAIVVEGPVPPDAVSQGLEGRIWGVRSPSFTLDHSIDLINSGCDFVVFESLETHAALLNDEGLGVIASVSTDMKEETARTLAELPVHGVLLTPPLRGFPLTIEDLMAVQAVRGLTDKPLLVEATEGLDSAALESLRLAGVDALIVGHESGKAACVREAILALPRRRERPKHRSALVPHPPAPTPSPAFDEDEEDF